MCALKRRIHTRGKRELHIEEVCCILKREQPRGSHLEKKKIVKRERAMCGEKIERKVQSVVSFERDSLCV